MKLRWTSYLVPIVLTIAATVAVFLSIPQREPSRQADSQLEVSSSNLSSSAKDNQYSPDEFERQVAEKREEMRQYDLQLQEYNRLAKKRIRYGADEITEDVTEGTLILKGYAWWRLDDNILGGQHDPKSVIVLDLDTHKVLRTIGQVEGSFLIR